MHMHTDTNASTDALRSIGFVGKMTGTLFFHNIMLFIMPENALEVASERPKIDFSWGTMPPDPPRFAYAWHMHNQKLLKNISRIAHSLYPCTTRLQSFQPIAHHVSHAHIFRAERAAPPILMMSSP